MTGTAMGAVDYSGHYSRCYSRCYGPKFRHYGNVIKPPCPGGCSAIGPKAPPCREPVRARLIGVWGRPLWLVLAWHVGGGGPQDAALMAIFYFLHGGCACGCALLCVNAGRCFYVRGGATLSPPTPVPPGAPLPRFSHARSRGNKMKPAVDLNLL
jgi:hypothetical protein